MKPSIFVTCMTFILVGFSGCGQDPEALHRQALEEWQDMRFGMFIHWGPVSLKGTEIGWSRGKEVPVEEYDQLYTQFNPVHFNANQWVRIAKEAGMKYLVITSKHHDGFSMWDTSPSDYDIMHSPFAGDVIAELAEACKDEGIAFGIYYSICDWYHPDYPRGSPGGTTVKDNPNMPRYVEFMKRQLTELIQNYGPLVTLWFDGEWEDPWTHELGKELYHFVRNQQPGILVNNRVDKGRKGMEGITTDRDQFMGDYETPEQRVGTYQPDYPWESCITIGDQWAWKPNDTLKSLKECIHTLVQTAGGGGNLLFNVGPMPDGRIEPRQAVRLQEVGRWLAQNGTSVYGTRAGPFQPGAWGVSTQAGKSVYLHVLHWPEEGLTLPILETPIRNAALLDGPEIPVSQTDVLWIPKPDVSDMDPIDTIVVLELDEPV